DLSRDRQPAALRLVARRHEAERQGGAGGRQARQGPRGALRLSAAVPRTGGLNVPADLGRDFGIAIAEKVGHPERSEGSAVSAADPSLRFLCEPHGIIRVRLAPVLHPMVTSTLTF